MLPAVLSALIRQLIVKGPSVIPLIYLRLLLYRPVFLIVGNTVDVKIYVGTQAVFIIIQIVPQLLPFDIFRSGKIVFHTDGLYVRFAVVIDDLILALRVPGAVVGDEAVEVFILFLDVTSRYLLAVFDPHLPYVVTDDIAVGVILRQVVEIYLLIIRKIHGLPVGNTVSLIVVYSDIAFLSSDGHVTVAVFVITHFVIAVVGVVLSAVVEIKLNGEPDVNTTFFFDSFQLVRYRLSLAPVSVGPFLGHCEIHITQPPVLSRVKLKTFHRFHAVADLVLVIFGLILEGGVIVVAACIQDRGVAGP